MTEAERIKMNVFHETLNRLLETQKRVDEHLREIRIDEIKNRLKKIESKIGTVDNQDSDAVRQSIEGLDSVSNRLDKFKAEFAEYKDKTKEHFSILHEKDRQVAAQTANLSERIDDLLGAESKKRQMLAQGSDGKSKLAQLNVDQMQDSKLEELEKKEQNVKNDIFDLKTKLKSLV